MFDVQNFPKSDAGFRDVIITEDTNELMRKIKMLNPFGEYIFMKNGKRIKGQAFTRRLYVICDKVEIFRQKDHGKLEISLKMLQGA